MPGGWFTVVGMLGTQVWLEIANGVKPPTSAASASDSDASCILCKVEKHPPNACSQIKSLTHDVMVFPLRSNGHCMNCLKPGHFSRQCPSLNHCRRCQRPHHTLLHIGTPASKPMPAPAVEHCVLFTCHHRSSCQCSPYDLLNPG